MTIITLFASHWWLADLLANLRVQQVVALLALLVTAAILRRWRCVLGAVILLAIHAPFFSSVWSSRGHAQSVLDAGRTSRVMLMNVLTSNSQMQRISAQVRTSDPDVFAVLELSTPLANHLESEFSDVYPHRVTRPMDLGNFGIGVFSKFPLEQVDVFQLNDSIESIAATVVSDSWSYRMVATHPLPPMGRNGFAKRNQHLFDLADRMRDFRDQQPDIPIVVVGDLNQTPWSPIFADWKRRIGLNRASNRFDLTPTWYARDHFVFGLVLDHVLIDETLACAAHHVGSDMGSDHRGVTVTLTRRE